MILNISVLGCGWLGLPLAKHLKEYGFDVKGSTTTREKLPILAEKKIVPFLIQLSPDFNGDDIKLFLESDLLILNIPPGRNKDSIDDYALKMKNIARAIKASSVKKLIFISSTSVYPEHNELEIDENCDIMASSESALRMLVAEQVFLNSAFVETTIIRMGGLIGPNRHPGRFFGGKKNIPNGLAPINLIYLDDCIGIVHHVIINNLWGQIFNGVSPIHPQKMSFYNLASQKWDNQTAEFIPEYGNYKIINSDKIINQYHYNFKFPDLMDWLEKS